MIQCTLFILSLFVCFCFSSNRTFIDEDFLPIAISEWALVDATLTSTRSNVFIIEPPGVFNFNGLIYSIFSKGNYHYKSGLSRAKAEMNVFAFGSSNHGIKEVQSSLMNFASLVPRNESINVLSTIHEMMVKITTNYGAVRNVYNIVRTNFAPPYYPAYDFIANYLYSGRINSVNRDVVPPILQWRENGYECPSVIYVSNRDVSGEYNSVVHDLRSMSEMLTQCYLASTPKAPRFLLAENGFEDSSAAVVREMHHYKLAVNWIIALELPSVLQDLFCVLAEDTKNASIDNVVTYVAENLKLRVFSLGIMFAANATVGLPFYCTKNQCKNFFFSHRKDQLKDYNYFVKIEVKRYNNSCFTPTVEFLDENGLFELHKNGEKCSNMRNNSVDPVYRCFLFRIEQKPTKSNSSVSIPWYTTSDVVESEELDESIPTVRSGIAIDRMTKVHLINNTFTESLASNITGLLSPTQRRELSLDIADGVDTIEVISIAVENGTIISSEERVIHSSVRPRVAFITAIYGGYEERAQPFVKQLVVKSDFIVFTDNSALEANNWIIDTYPYHTNIRSAMDNGRYYNSLENNLHSFNICKYYKQNFYNIPRLRDYDIVVWVDGTIRISFPYVAFWLWLRMHKPIEEKNDDCTANKNCSAAPPYSGAHIISVHHGTRGGSLLEEVQLSLELDRYKTGLPYFQRIQPILEQYVEYLKNGYYDNADIDGLEEYNNSTYWTQLSEEEKAVYKYNISYFPFAHNARIHQDQQEQSEYYKSSSKVVEKFALQNNNTIHRKDVLGVWMTCFVAVFNQNLHKPIPNHPSARVRAFMDDWYLQTLNHSTQDQVGFPYVVQKHVLGDNDPYNPLYLYTFPDMNVKLVRIDDEFHASLHSDFYVKRHHNN